MTTLEVCEICDIAECSHIRARRASTGGLSPYVGAYRRSAYGWHAVPIMSAPTFGRQSTLRVRRIRWKAGLHESEIDNAHAALTAKGAVTNILRPFGPYGHCYGIISAVTWPESKQ